MTLRLAHAVRLVRPGTPWVITAICLGAIASVAPVATILTSAIVASVWLCIRDLTAFARSVSALLIVKPLIDLTWRWDLFQVGAQGVNSQALVGVLLATVIGTAMVFKGKELLRSHSITLFLGSAILSVAVNASGEGVNELVRLCAGLSLFYVAGLSLSTERAFDRFAGWFLLAVTVPIVLSLLQVGGMLPFEYWDWQGGSTVGRASGSYQHPLGLVYFIIYAVPLSLYLLRKERRLNSKSITLLCFLLLSGVSLYLTYHRAALMAAGLGIVVWLIMGRAYVATGLILAAAAGCLIWVSSVREVFSSLIALLHGHVGIWSGEFLRGRGINWYLFLASLFGAHPAFWWFGRGASVAEGMVPGFGFWISNEPHSDIIRVLHAYGIVGLALYGWVLVSLFRESVFLWREGGAFERGVARVTIVCLTSVIVLSVTTEPLRYPSGVWYVFALGSVVSARALRYREVDVIA